MKYILMNKNIEVLKFLYDEETHTIQKIEEEINIEYAPPGIVDYKTGISRKAFNNWWKDRAIPASRSKFKDVLAELNITSSIELLERCFGLSLSDQYWIKEEFSNTEWKDINFFQHPFSEDMGKLLMGQIEYSNNLDIFSPDNSSDGNLRKKWKIVDGKRCLLKGGNSLNNQEPFNEIIATKLYELLLEEDEFVPYELVQENNNFYSSCITMVSVDEELVPAYYIDKMQELRGSESLYEHYIHVCEGLDIPNARLHVDKMLICDFIIANYDRHYRNFGAIRNVETLNWERIAPIYDSGSSMWATTATPMIEMDYKSKPFMSSPENQLKLVKDLSWLDIDKLIGFKEMVKEILDKNPLMDSDRSQIISQQVHRRINKVIDRKKELSAN